MMEEEFWMLPVCLMGEKRGGNGAGKGQGVPAVAGGGGGGQPFLGAASPHECSQQQRLRVTVAMSATLPLSSPLTSNACRDGLEGCVHPWGGSATQTPAQKTWGPLHRAGCGGGRTRPRCHQGPSGMGVPRGHSGGTGWCLTLGTCCGEGEEGEGLWGDTGSGVCPPHPCHGGVTPPPQAYNYRRCPWRARRGYVTLAFGKFFLLPYQLYKYLELGPGQAGGEGDDMGCSQSPRSGPSSRRASVSPSLWTKAAPLHPAAMLRGGLLAVGVSTGAISKWFLPPTEKEGDFFPWERLESAFLVMAIVK